VRDQKIATIAQALLEGSSKQEKGVVVTFTERNKEVIKKEGEVFERSFTFRGEKQEIRTAGGKKKSQGVDLQEKKKGKKADITRLETRRGV